MTTITDLQTTANAALTEAKAAVAAKSAALKAAQTTVATLADELLQSQAAHDAIAVASAAVSGAMNVGTASAARLRVLMYGGGAGVAGVAAAVAHWGLKWF